MRVGVPVSFLLASPIGVIWILKEQVESSQVKSSQVSRNARRRAQGGKEKNMYVHTKFNDCTTCRCLWEHVAASIWMNQKCGKVGNKPPHRTAFLATISNLTYFRRPREHFVFFFSRAFVTAECSVARTVFFFFSAPFSRRRSLVDDCFTGQSPGSAISIPAAPDVHEGLGQIQVPALSTMNFSSRTRCFCESWLEHVGTNDASHFYTSGSRMCIGEGQFQAGLLTKGLGVGCSGGGWWLQRGSHWWRGRCPQGCDSLIRLGQGEMLRRHAWPRAWAWRSNGGSGRWWGSGAEGLFFILHADSAANHWLQLSAATHQFRSPNYGHENETGAWSHLLGGRPLLLDGADGKLCTQSSKGNPNNGCSNPKYWLETILVANRH